MTAKKRGRPRTEVIDVSQEAEIKEADHTVVFSSCNSSELLECIKCGQTKQISEFYKSSLSARNRSCIDCTVEASKTRYESRKKTDKIMDKKTGFELLLFNRSKKYEKKLLKSPMIPSSAVSSPHSEGSSKKKSKRRREFDISIKDIETILRRHMIADSSASSDTEKNEEENAHFAREPPKVVNPLEESLMSKYNIGGSEAKEKQKEIDLIQKDDLILVRKNRSKPISKRNYMLCTKSEARDLLKKDVSIFEEEVFKSLSK